jgi:hypothetical protein
VIYSVGSFDLYNFEATLLNRTVCDIHVFDPTVLPSRLREREAELNSRLPKSRIWWHSFGIAAADNPSGTCALLPVLSSLLAQATALVVSSFFSQHVEPAF